MSTLNAAKLLESGNLLTPKGRMVYPALFTPSLARGETDKDKARYQVTLLLPKGSDIKALKDAVTETLDENVSAKARTTAKIKTPFLKTEDQPRFAEFAEEFPLMLRFNAKFKPDVVTPKGDRTLAEDEEADEVYSGRWGRVSCRAFFYDHPTGGKGVSLGLQNVQLLDHDEPIAGGRVKGTAEFEGVGDDSLADLDDDMAA